MFMKKFLFLMLSAAVAVSASAGINFKQEKKGMFGRTPVAVTAQKVDKKAPKTKMAKSLLKATDFAIRDYHIDINERFRGASDVISEQPEGTLKTYTRSEDALCTAYSNSQVGFYYQSSDYPVDIVYADDGQTVWIKDIQCYLNFGTWVRGTISGNKITVPLGQFISWNSTYGYGRILAWGTYDPDAEVFTTDESVSEVTYTISDNTITLDNSSFDWDTFNMTGLTSIWDDDLSWGNFMECLTVLTYAGEPEPEPTIYPNVQDLAVEPGVTTGDVTWTDPNCTEWYLRYREYVPNGNYFWDFETEDSYGEWSSIDADEDGYDWFPASFSSEGFCPSGVGAFISESWDSETNTALTPENYLISPEVNLHGKLTFYACGNSSSETYAKEHFIVYVLTDDLYQVGEEIETTQDFVKYEFDLSEYEGQVGNVIICHCNCTDMVQLVIDDVFIGDPNSDVMVPDWIYVEDPITETNYTIEGLTPETQYEVQVVGFAEDGHSYWSDSEIFTTLAEAPAIPDVYILGEVNEQYWAPNAGEQMDYDEENGIYFCTVTLDGRNSGYNYFSFTTELAENNDQGGWDYIKPFRFGAVTDGQPFLVSDEWLNKPLSLAMGGDNDPIAFQVPAGEYELYLDYVNMSLTIKKVVRVLRGDVNDDQEVSVADVTLLIDYLLSDGSLTINEENANANLDDTISVADVTAIIDYLMTGQWAN